MSIVCDRTKTVVRRHVAPGEAVALQVRKRSCSPGTTTSASTSWRPTGEGRVERQVDIVRDHVLAGRVFALRRGDGLCVHGLGGVSYLRGGPAPTARSSACGPSHRLAAAAPNVLCRRPAALAASGQGLPGRLRRKPLLGAGPKGPFPSAGRGPGGEVAGGAACRPSPPMTARLCWPLTRARSAKGSAWSAKGTGTACQMARTAVSPPATSCPVPAVKCPWAKRLAHCRPCWPGPRPPASRPAAVRCRSTTN